MNRKRILGLFFFMSFCLGTEAATLTALVAQNENTGTSSIRCVFSGSFRYQTLILTHPDRVVLDIHNTTTRLDVAHTVKGRGLIIRARAGRPKPQTLRLVFELAAPAQLTAKLLNGNVLSLQLVSKSLVSKSQKTKILSKPTQIKKTQQAKQTQTSSRAHKHALRDVIIVLDPGHGGHDPGAIGPSHRVEKQVVLAIAQQLKQLIDKQPGMRAVLTRDGDYYVGLRERLMIARKHNADVFIAIHADAFINTHSHGASVFALSPRGATSEAARWLAEKENYSELGGVNLKGLDDKNGLIRTVLLDLSQTATIASSLQLGTQVLQDLDRMTTLHNNHVEQARFVVLKSPDTPSILVETGFISNPEEAKNLTNSRYQARLSQAIFAGLKRYFWSYPPHGTRLEAMSNASRPVIGARVPQVSMDAVA